MKHRFQSLTALLLAVLLVLALAACGSSGKDSASSEDDSTADVQERETVQESTPVEETAQSSDNEDGVTLTETTVIDNEACSITFKDYTVTRIGCTIQAELENKSDLVTYTFAVDSASVNGVATDPMFAAEVSPGETSTHSITFSSSDLTDNDITQFTDIAITFRVYAKDDPQADDAVYETIHLYPYGEDQAVQYVRETQSTDDVVIDTDEVTVVILGCDPENYWGYGVDVYFTNKTDTEVMFSVYDATVNGCTVDPFFAKSVPAGTSAFATISWSSSSLEKNGIETVEEITFNMRVHDNNDWDADDMVSQVITLHP